MRLGSFRRSPYRVATEATSTAMHIASGSFRITLTSDHAQGSREGEQRADREQGCLLGQMDDCITNASDGYRRSKFNDPEPAKATRRACQFGDLDDRMIDCTLMLTEQLYSIINGFSAADRTRSTRDPFKENISQVQGGSESPSRYVPSGRGGLSGRYSPRPMSSSRAC
jgi:hypothetical protein